MPLCRYATRAKRYAQQRKQLVAQAGIEDSLLCSSVTDTATAGVSSMTTTVSSFDDSTDASCSTAYTDSSSMYQLGGLPLVPEHGVCQMMYNAWAQKPELRVLRYQDPT